jgi:hypothetical protein
MAEHEWQFRVTDGGTHLSDNGLGFFEVKATAMALMSGCHLVSSRNVTLEQWHNDVLMVMGTAIVAPN